MTHKPDVGAVSGKKNDRRSSVRASSLLPCSLESIDKEDVAAVEARILDLAVIEGDSSFDEQSMWDERSDELSREVVLVLNEIRALRRKFTEVQRVMERDSEDGMTSRWITINDRGFHVALDEEERDYEVDDLLEVQLEIPSVYTRNVLAVGEVIRVDEEPTEERDPGIAVEFRSISQIHEKAIMRYALLRERHLARSDRFSGDV
ncbi:MAG: hypothetical protein ABEN55_08055 [Bradymonadaceae bacterium]